MYTRYSGVHEVESVKCSSCQLIFKSTATAPETGLPDLRLQGVQSRKASLEKWNSLAAEYKKVTRITPPTLLVAKLCCYSNRLLALLDSLDSCKPNDMLV